MPHTECLTPEVNVAPLPLIPHLVIASLSSSYAQHQLSKALPQPRSNLFANVLFANVDSQRLFRRSLPTKNIYTTHNIQLNSKTLLAMTSEPYLLLTQ
ncbi:MAG: hypothetical protein ACRCYY_16755 [Trueperaceae bacterium]